VKLTPMEEERLLLFLAAELARKRKTAGLKLNHPEAVALIADEVMEAGRAGATFEEAEAAGYRTLGEEDVLEGVAELVDRVQVEPLLEEGTQLITLHFPIKRAAPAEDGQ
jgi:urease subunit gamma/beta